MQTELSTHQRQAALHVITDFDRENKLASSALALMFEALDVAEGFIRDGVPVADAISREFTNPLSSRIIKVILAEARP